VAGCAVAFQPKFNNLIEVSLRRVTQVDEGDKMQLDMLVVGAGFAGIYQLYKAREAGMTVRVLEAGEGVGGTWFWNRYPGARCDVESLDYSYSFCRELEEEWEWTIYQLNGLNATHPRVRS
jgi:monoamine oxidase